MSALKVGLVGTRLVGAFGFVLLLSAYTGSEPARAETPVANCLMGDCDGGKGDCVTEPILTCDGLTGKKCVFPGRT